MLRNPRVQKAKETQTAFKTQLNQLGIEDTATSHENQTPASGRSRIR
jgi:hypothetical protein